MKLAKVLALHKKKEFCYPEHYRPISLLSCLDKLFEKLLYRRFMKFIQKHKLIIHGFFKNHSTTLALINLVDKIKDIMDNGKYALVIYLDLKKAFDTVNHDILLEKLSHYGFRGNAYSLIKSYLKDRMQYTCVNNVMSDICSIDTGVPQGSVLDPLFFLLYVNDIVHCINDEDASLFADDTAALLHDKNLRLLKMRAETCLSKLYNWLVSNKLSLSIEKTFFIIYHSKRRKIPNEFDFLKLHNFSIQRVKFIKYLGMTMYENRSWEMHIKQLCSSISKYFGVFYNIRNILTIPLKTLLYYSFIHSRISYGIELYGACSQTLLNKIQTLQNKLLKVLFNKPYRTGTNDLHHELRLLKVDDLYRISVLNFVYKAVNRESIDQFSNYFHFRDTIHGHNTRGKKQIIRKKVTNNYGKSTVHYQGANLWNLYSQHSTSVKTCNSFKRKMRNIFIDSYSP